MGILSDIFGMRKSHESGMFYREVDVNEDDNGELGHEGDNVMVNEDPRYERLLEQVEHEQYQGSKFSKLSFLLHLLQLKCM